MKILEIDEWADIGYPSQKLGDVEITHTNYNKGYYTMENVKGYDIFKVNKKIKVTVLKIKNKQVMVDDPLHWIGMQDIAEKSSGNVCVAGLGLGLIIHHLVKNSEVQHIDIYEINKEVIELIFPLLPKDKELKL